MLTESRAWDAGGGGDREDSAGPDHTIADIAGWPWISRWAWPGPRLDDDPAVRRWHKAIRARPAAQRDYDVPAFGHAIPA